MESGGVGWKVIELRGVERGGEGGVGWRDDGGYSWLKH